MSSDFDSHQHVDDLMDSLANTPDDQLLVQLAETEPLPDEDDSVTVGWVATQQIALHGGHVSEA